MSNKDNFRYVLALDLGVGSIGHCLSWFKGDTFIDCLLGSSIIANDETSYMKGNFESSARKRTLERSARKNLNRKKTNKKKVAKLLSILGYENDKYDNLNLLKIKGLSDRIELKELSAILYSYACYRGYNELTDINHEDNKKGGLKDLSYSLKGECDKENITISQYFQNSNKNIRRNNIFPNNHVLQEMYIDELKKIYKKQQEFHDVLTDDYLEKLIKQIYFRLPLKSVNNLKNKCIFEKVRSTTPHANPLFQEYRAWSSIHNIRVVSHNFEITPRIKQLIFDKLKTKEVLKDTDIIKIIEKESGLKNISLNKISIKGLTTFLRIKKYGYDIYNSLDKTEEKPFGLCWEDIYSNVDYTTRYNIGKVDLEKNRCALSNKAISKLLPYMNGEIDYLDAYSAEQKVYPSVSKEVSKNINDLETLKTNDLRNPVVTRIINNAIKIIKEYSKDYNIDEVKIEMVRAMNQSASKREQIDKDNKKKESVNNFIKDIIKKHFKVSSESIKNIEKVKMWLEQANVSVHFTNLSELKNIDINSLKSYCLYSGEKIKFNNIFNTSEIDVEHSVPKSRVFDDSFANKTLSYKNYNKKKDNLTSFEYMIDNNMVMKEFDSFSFNKKKNLKYANISYITETNGGIDISKKAEFGASSLNNTSYIAKFLVSHIKDYFRKVSVTNGSITNYIKNFQFEKDVHFSQVLNESNFPLYVKDNHIRVKKSKRDDNRHHALDAFIISITNDRHKQALSKINNNCEKYIKNDIIGNVLGGQSPKDFIDNILIPKFKNLVVNIKKPKPIIYKKNNSICVRNSVFGATIYGKTNIDGVEYITKKMRIDEIRYYDIENIIDKSLKDDIKEIIKPFETIISKKEKINIFQFVIESKSEFYGELNFNTNFGIKINSFNIKDRQNNIIKKIKCKMEKMSPSYISTKSGIYTGSKNTNIIGLVKKDKSGKFKTDIIPLYKAVNIRHSKKIDIYDGVVYKIKPNDYFVLGYSVEDIIDMNINGKKDEYLKKLFYVTEVGSKEIKMRPHYIGKGGDVLIVQNETIKEFSSQSYYLNNSINSFVNIYKILTKVKIDTLGNLAPLSSLSNNICV